MVLSNDKSIPLWHFLKRSKGTQYNLYNKTFHSLFLSYKEDTKQFVSTLIKALFCNIVSLDLFYDKWWFLSHLIIINKFLDFFVCQTIEIKSNELSNKLVNSTDSTA